jgi:hypothetical protein
VGLEAADDPDVFARRWEALIKGDEERRLGPEVRDQGCGRFALQQRFQLWVVEAAVWRTEEDDTAEALVDFGDNVREGHGFDGCL